MKYFVKNMKCPRCKVAVKSELRKLGLHYVFNDTGEITIREEMSAEQRVQLDMRLRRSGFELMDDKKSLTIEKIKNIINDIINISDEGMKINLSYYLSTKLNYNYTYLANLFSEEMGITIEHYYIVQKVEKVKELIAYEELNLKEIAFRMHYSSVAHLSKQFKMITGLTPSHFKQLRQKRQYET